MNLVLHLASDAVADLRRLDARLQEEVLDELERLTDKSELIPPPLANSGIIHTFAREVAGAVHVIAIDLEWPMGGSRLAVLGIQLLSKT